MAGEITKEFILKVIADGIKKATADLGKLNKGTKDTTKSAKRYTGANNRLYTSLQGISGSTANSTKAFAKMSQGMGGLVPIYASVAANVFALTAAFGALREAADFTILKKATDDYGSQTGVSLNTVIEKVKELTLGMVKYTDVARHASIVTAAGFGTKSFEKLAKVARNASLALGRDMGDSLDRLVRGTIKAEPELLDELGIILRLEPATKKYAKALNKTVKELTTFEKQQAVLNEVLEQGNQKFRDLGEANLVNNFTKLASTFDEVSKAGLALFNNVLGPVAGFFADNMGALAAAVTLFAVSILKKTLPLMGDFTKAVANTLAVSTAKSQLAMDNFTKSRANLAKAIKQTRSEYAKQLGATDKLLVGFLKKAEAHALKSNKRISKGVKNALALSVGDPKFYKKMTQIMAAGMTRIQNGVPTLHLEVTKGAEKELAALIVAAKDANKKIQAGLKKTELAHLSAFERIRLGGASLYTGLTQGFLGFLNTTIVGGLAGASAGFSKGFSGVFATMRDIQNETGKATVGAYSITSGFQAVGKSATGASKGIKLVTAGIGGIAGATFKYLPMLANLTIAWTVIEQIANTLLKAIGRVNKATESLDATLDKGADTLLDVTKATIFYDKELTKLGKTMDNDARKASHRSNTYKSLIDFTEELASSLSVVGSFGGVVDRALSFVGAGRLEKTIDAVRGITSALEKIGGRDAIKTLAKAFKPIEELDGEGLKKYIRGLEKLLRANEKVHANTIANTKAIKEYTTAFKDAITAGSKLPKLNPYEQAEISFAKTIKQAKEMGTVLEALQKIGSADFKIFNVDPKEFGRIASLQNAIAARQVKINKLLETPGGSNTDLYVALYKRITIQREALLAAEQSIIDKVTDGLSLRNSEVSLIRQIRREVDANNKTIASSNTLLSDKIRLLEANKDKEGGIFDITLKSRQAELLSTTDKAKRLSIIKAIRAAAFAYVSTLDTITQKEDNITGAIVTRLFALKTQNTQAAEALALAVDRETAENKITRAIKAGADAARARSKAVGESPTQQDTAANIGGDTSRIKQLTKGVQLARGILDDPSEDATNRERILANAKVSMDELVAAAAIANDKELGARKLLGLAMLAVDDKRNKQLAKNALDNSTALIQKARAITSAPRAGSSERDNIKATHAKQVEELRASLAVTDDITLKARKELNDAIRALDEDLQTDLLANALETTQAIINLMGNLAGTLGQVYAAKSQRSLDAVNENYGEQAKVVDAALAQETANIEASVNMQVISKEEGARRQIAANSARDTQLTELERQRQVDADKTARKEFERSQAFNRVQVIMSTATAAMNSFASASLWGGPVAGAAAAAVAVAAGVAQLAAINNTSFDSGSSIAPSSPTGGYQPNISLPQQPGGADASAGGGTTTIKVIGDKNAIYSADTMDELIDNIREAVTRRDKILIEHDSRNGLDIVGSNV